MRGHLRTNLSTYSRTIISRHLYGSDYDSDSDYDYDLLKNEGLHGKKHGRENAMLLKT